MPSFSLGTLIGLLTRNSTATMVAALVLGLVWQDGAALAFPFIQPAVLLMMTMSLMRLDVKALRLALARPAPMLAGLAVVLIVCPLAAAGLMAIGLGSEEMLLNALAPPMTAVPALAIILDLDFTLTLVIMVLGTLAFPIGLSVAVAMGAIGAIPGGVMTVVPRVLLMVGGPVVVAMIGRRLLGTEGLVRQRQTFDVVMMLLLIFFAVALMDGANVIMKSAPDRVWPIVIAACLYNPVAQAIFGLAFYWWGGRRAMSLGLVAGNRNLGVVLAIMAGLSGPDFAAYVAFAQLPIYTLPALTKFFFGKRIKRWKDAETEAAP